MKCWAVEMLDTELIGEVAKVVSARSTITLYSWAAESVMPKDWLDVPGGRVSPVRED